MHIGSLKINKPDDVEAYTLQGKHRDAVLNFVKSSPEYTIYHSLAYIELAEKHNGTADILALASKDKILAAIPFHPTRKGFNTGFSGILFPELLNEKTMNQVLQALKSFFKQNSHLKFINALQAQQSEGSSDRSRSILIDYLFTQLASESPKLFTRVKHLDFPKSFEGKSNLSGHLTLQMMTDASLKSYEPKKRSEIRLADKNGLKVDYFFIQEPELNFIKTAYEKYLQIHEESWNRTGLKPHEREYWYDLSQTIARGGGIDLVVVVSDAEDKPVAAVTAHILGNFAIYWSGCSKPEGLKKCGNSLALHSAMWLAGGLGVRQFELGRFTLDEQSEKERKITHYKSQFGGTLLPVPVLKIERFDLAFSLRRTLVGMAKSLKQSFRKKAVQS